MAHPPRIPVWLRDELPVIYFVTICVANRKPVLANRRTLDAVRKAAQRLTEWTLLAAVLMPDHVHAITTPTNDRDACVGNFSAALKRWIRDELDAQWQSQPGCFDRLLRSNESLNSKWIYLQDNPVRAGLVKDRQDWAYTIGFDGEEE